MKVEIDFTFRAEKAHIAPGNYKEVEVSVEGAHKCDVLEQFDLEDVIYCFEEGKILDHIGKDRVMEYFGLTESEE